MTVEHVTQKREYGDLASYSRLKDQLVGSLHGRVLEIGVGNGANFGLLSPDVSWTGLEPSRRRRERLHDERVIGGVAEDIPLPDGSVDAVLGTTVLCSVRSQDAALREIRRVLRRGGRFVFFEHVAAPRSSWTRRLQHAIAPANRLLDAGCDPSRETWRALEQEPFRALDMHWFRSGRWPLIGGFAVA